MYVCILGQGLLSPVRPELNPYISDPLETILVFCSVSFSLRIEELLKILAKLGLLPSPDPFPFSLSRIPSWVCSYTMGCSRLITQLSMEVQGSTLQAC